MSALDVKTMAVTVYNPFRPPVFDRPSLAYEHLLTERPVHYFGDFDPPFYTLSRYADVQGALRDIDTYSSEFGQGPRFTPPAGMLSNPPQHAFFRSLVQQAFSPRAIGAMHSRVEALAEELLEECAVGEWDLHDAFAFPLPVVIIAEMLGVPSSDLHLFKRWSDASVAAMGAADPSAYASELAELANYILAQIRERRAAPGRGDLIDGLVQAEQDGRRLADDEILSVVNQLLVGGNETTTSLITNVVWRLLERPDLWRRLVAESGLTRQGLRSTSGRLPSAKVDSYDNLVPRSEDLVHRALEESLRFDPPVLGLYRSTTRAVELHGVRIPKNAKVMLHYAAANRDPSVWEAPNTFSLDRPAQRHLAFGLGVHFCLGAQLARLEAGTALRALVRHCPDLRLVDAGERIAPFFLWGRRHLPVSLGRV